MTDDVRELLPWYVTGTLSEQEKAAVEALLEESAEARDELEWLRQLHRTAQNVHDTQPSDLGWQRLRQEIKREQPAPPKPETESSNVIPIKRGKWLPKLAVAASLIVAVQVGILYQQGQDDTAIQPLSEDITALENSWVVQVKFDTQADWQEILGILDASSARILDGPSPTGLVRLRVDRLSSSYKSVEELITWLQAQPSIVHAASDATD